MAAKITAALLHHQGSDFVAVLLPDQKITTMQAQLPQWREALTGLFEAPVVFVGKSTGGQYQTSGPVPYSHWLASLEVIAGINWKEFTIS